MTTISAKVARINKLADRIETDAQQLARLQAGHERRRNECAAAKGELALAVLASSGLLHRPAAEIVHMLRGHEPRTDVSTEDADDPPVDRETNVDRKNGIDVIVKMSGNAGAQKRDLLLRTGLRWNGKRRYWLGRVAAELMGELLEMFGDRLSIQGGSTIVDIGPDLVEVDGEKDQLVTSDLNVKSALEGGSTVVDTAPDLGEVGGQAGPSVASNSNVKAAMEGGSTGPDLGEGVGSVDRSLNTPEPRVPEPPARNSFRGPVHPFRRLSR